MKTNITLELDMLSGDKIKKLIDEAITGLYFNC